MNRDVLIDSCVLLNLARADCELKRIASQCVVRLFNHGVRPTLTLQNLIEFWCGATRPQSANGLGLDCNQAFRDIELFQSFFHVFEEPADLRRTWLQIVRNYEVKGKKVHDARLAAAMKYRRIRHMITFDVKDFKRYDGMVILNPMDSGWEDKLLNSLPSYY